jgi:hypothetical protein
VNYILVHCLHKAWCYIYYSIHTYKHTYILLLFWFSNFLIIPDNEIILYKQIHAYCALTIIILRLSIPHMYIFKICDGFYKNFWGVWDLHLPPSQLNYFDIKQKAVFRTNKKVTKKQTPTLCCPPHSHSVSFHVFFVSVNFSKQEFHENTFKKTVGLSFFFLKKASFELLKTNLNFFKIEKFTGLKNQENYHCALHHHS